MASAQPNYGLMFPEYQASQLAIQRQQELAKYMMEQGAQQSDPYGRAGALVVPKSPMEGLAKMAQQMMGAYYMKDADQKSLQSASGQQQALAQLLGGTPPATQMAQAPQQQTPWVNPDTQQLAEMPAASMNNVAPAAGASPAPTTSPAMPSSGFGPAGMPQNQRMLAYMMSPEAYTKAAIDQYTPTESARLAREAGADPQTHARAMMAKNAYIAPIEERPGTLTRDPLTRQPIGYMPHLPDGALPSFDASGNVQSVKPVAGVSDVMQQNSAAQAAGKAQFDIQNVVDPETGAKIPTTAYNLANAANGQVGANGAQAQPMMTALPPGQAEAQTVVAKGNADARNNLVKSASESPMRVNVLDNIINLSKEGVQTGYGQEWKNKALGYAANTPGIQAMIPADAKNKVVGFQEMQKFLNQNGQRAWTAAGGTGTDAQLSAALRANPNDQMFPQALQTVAQWAKGGELALQAKGNAQDAWVNTQGNHVAKLDKFESQWRNNYDPRIFQLQAMSPEEQQAFVAKLKSEDKQALIKKTQTLSSMGAF